MRARRTVVLATVLAPVVGLGWFTASASAFFTGVQRVGATSVSSSANKGVTVACPAGKKVTSAGVDVNPVPGDVLVDDIRPDATLTKVTVRAVEDETGTSANWTVTALAICAPPAAGLQRVAAGQRVELHRQERGRDVPRGQARARHRRRDQRRRPPAPARRPGAQR